MKMSNKATQILLIEDNPGDARLIQEMLSEIHDMSYNVQIADRLSAGLDCLMRKQVDIVLLDLGLPDSQGLDTLNKVRAKARGLPIVVLTSLEDETIAVEAVRHGAQDYLTKRQVHTRVLWRVISYAFERQQLSQALETSEEQYRALVENANEAIIVAQDGMLKFVNPKATDITGYSKEKLLSMPFIELVHPDDRSMVLERHSKRLRGEQLPQVYTFKIVDRWGQTKWVEINAVVISWNDRPATLNFLTDITERKKSEQQILLASKLASVGELAAGVAHEINNPLTGVIGYSQLLMDRQDVAPDIKKDLNRIYRESQRTVKIVQNLLSFARRHKPEKDYVDINHLIEQTLELQSYTLKTSNVALATKLEPGLPLIMADYNQLQQVILNIMTNALQAIAETKRKGRITVTTNKDKSHVRISITDNGSGIPAGYIDRVFDPFFTTKSAVNGSGLGLSVCHGIISEHGGSIHVESMLGKGSTFVIGLPIATESQAAVEMREVVEKGQERHKAKAVGKILIVEDEAMISDIISTSLSQRGYRSDIASDGKAALKKLARNVYDMCLADLKMPGMSGIELYEIIKEKYPNLATRVVFMTGDTINTETNNFLMSTGRPHLDKPFDCFRLVKLVDEVLQKND
jgi:PAS domain S-box-containing protein